MTISGIGSGPQGAMMRAIVALREERAVEREAERDAAHQAIEAVEARAEHAAERAEAMQRSAWLQFGMSVAGSAFSAGSSACSAVSAGLGEGGEGPRPWDAASRGLSAGRDAAGLGPEGPVTAWDRAFGAGADATRLDAEMEEDSLRADRARLVEGEHRARREEIDDQLAEVRGAYRDLDGSEGGA